jgi:DNA-binding NarL/FixJ family response regulator
VRPRAVVVAHREAMLAEGIAAALAPYPGIVPIGVATTPSEAEAKSERADAVALDRSLPDADALARRLRSRGLRVVLLETEHAPVNGDGGISTRMPVSALASALAPETRNGMKKHPRGLTGRQRQILTLVSRGFAAKQVARHLGISEKTVENHKTRIFAKLGVPNQTAAVAQLLVNGRERNDPWIRSSI